MNFTCRKLDCKYNNKFNCDAEKVNIDKDLNCDMYQKDESKQTSDTTKTMFDIVPEMAPYRHHTKCSISCEANCIFNKNGECYSNGILVNQSLKKPAVCFSHLKK